jgi:hypothetical protein
MLRWFNKHRTQIAQGVFLAIGFFGLFGVVYGKLQYDLAKQQFELAQLREPHFEYSSRLVLSPTDQKVASDASKQLLESFFEQVYQYTRSKSGVTYLEGVDAVLPLTTTLPARSLAAITTIRNNGLTTVTKVRAFVTTDRPITSFDVLSLEPYARLKGGIGEKELTIELDRIVAGNAVTITIVSQIAESGRQSDRVVLQSCDPKKGNSDLKSLLLGKDVYCPSDSPFTVVPSTNFLPVLRYIPAFPPTISVKVTSEQGPGYPIRTPTAGP